MTLLSRHGRPIELRPNTSRTHHMLVVRDENGGIVERTMFNGSQGMVVELGDLPAVHQIAIYPPAAPGGGLFGADGAPLKRDMPRPARG